MAKELNLFAFLIAIAPLQSAALGFFARISASAKDRFLVLYDGDDVVGGAVLLFRDCPGDCIELTYLFVKAERRGEGLAKRLLQAAMESSKRAGERGMTCRLAESGDFGDIMRHLLEKYGFSHGNTAHIFQCAVDKPTQETWDAICGRGFLKLYAWLERQGFACVSFLDADESLVALAMDDAQSGFDRQYSPAFLNDGARGKLLRDYSFIAHRNGVPAAVTMVLEADQNTAVFQLISASEQFKHTGAVLMPIMRSMAQIFTFAYSSVFYCIFDSNEPMLKLAKELFLPMIVRQTAQLCYACDLDKIDSGFIP